MVPRNGTKMEAAPVGHDILERQEHDGWGANVVDRFSHDMREEFPDQQGWSPSNLRYMRRVARVWPTEDEFLQRDVGELPWGHVTVLLDRLSTREDRDWYASQCFGTFKNIESVLLSPS